MHASLAHRALAIASDDIDATPTVRLVLGMTSGPHPDFGSRCLDVPRRRGTWSHRSEREDGGRDPEAIPRPHVQGTGPGTGAIDHIAFRSTGLRDMLHHLRAERVAFSQRRANGQALFQLFFHDPNGIKIELNFDAAETEGIAPELMASDLMKAP